MRMDLGRWLQICNSHCEVNAESIGRRAERGRDVSRYFTNAGRMMPPVQRVNVDFALDMLQRPGLRLIRRIAER